MLNIREFINDILYVGVDDRTTTKFEALWALPDGVTYNSYIVKDKKNALIDTVELGKSNQFLGNLRETIDGAGIDYLVINHMEPDHSGSIPEIMRAYPQIRIVGNKLTLGMVKGFYGIDDPTRLIEVADGDSISLGEKTLVFRTTPMVHWPETMMTYCPERKTLFSGDAFGTFGALKGSVTDDECDTEVFMREMHRYYACIVAKYNTFVQRAMQKLAGLDLAYICSTHGPVWHESIDRVVSAYDRMSRGETEKGVTIVYGSMYGNTEIIAERLARSLGAAGVEEVRVHNASYSDMSHIISDAYRYRGLIVGSPTYSMNIFPPVETFLQAMVTREIKNKVFASFGSYTWASGAKKLIDAYAEKQGWINVGGMDFKQSPATADLAEADRVAKAMAEALRNP